MLWIVKPTIPLDFEYISLPTRKLILVFKKFVVGKFL